jgi:23S rRNA (uracil1939-C5)-methyltransferase
VLLPAIAGNLPALRAIAATLQATEAHITVLATPAGLDVSAECRPTRRDARVVGRLAQLAGGHGIARISLNGEVIVERARPSLAFAGAVVTPPPGAFVQATAEGEAALSALVADAVAGAKRIADLFCGIGTLTFPLARLAPVLAVDCEQPALAALAAAAKATQGLKPIETCVRDLFREPLSVKELAGWEAIVLDPPHAGASAQVEQIAHCGASSVVYVSCNPATLARDARLLVDAGYRIAGVTPIDQFVFAADVEVVAVLNRDTRPSHGTKRPTRRA